MLRERDAAANPGSWKALQGKPSGKKRSNAGKNPLSWHAPLAQLVRASDF